MARVSVQTVQTPLSMRVTAARAPVIVGVLCVVALILRVVLATDWLAGDELFARYDVLDGGPGDVIARLRAGDPVSPEVSPPLYFLLAWLAHAVVGTDEALRIPSVLASVVTVWLVYALGRRAFGAPAGVAAAAMWTFAPFAIFYGSEARPYGLLAALCAASLLALLVALERGGRWRWVVVALTSAAVVYTHYVGVGIIVAQAAWAFVAHPSARRAIAAAYIAAAVSFLPWIGELRTDPLFSYAFLAPDGIRDVLERFAQALPGHPFVPLRAIPGAVATALFVGVAILVTVLAIAQRGRSAGAWPAMARSARGALVLAALATPAALLLFSVIGDHTVFLVRSLTPSAPAAVVLLAGLACAVRPRALGAGLTAVLVAVLAFGAGRTLDPDHRRPDYAPIAAYLDRVAQPGDLVVHSTLAFEGTALDQVLARGLSRPLPEAFLGLDDDRVWDRAARARRVYLLVARQEPWVRTRPPAATGLVEVGRGPTAGGWTPVDTVVLER